MRSGLFFFYPKNDSLEQSIGFMVPGYDFCKVY